MTWQRPDRTLRAPDPLSSFAVEDSNQRLRVPERVVHGMVIVLRSTETLPFLSASKISHQSRVEVGDPSPGMPERIRFKAIVFVTAFAREAAAASVDRLLPREPLSVL
jgi:hypothetical protein